MSQELIDLIYSDKTAAALAELENEETQSNINKQFEYESLYKPATCLFAACLRGNEPVVNKLLGLKGIDVNKGSTLSFTPLHAATDRHQSRVIEILLKEEGILCEGNNDGNTPIHTAANKGYDDILLLLLGKFPAEINCQSNNQSTPLHQSVINGHLSTTSSLLQHGAQCLVDENGENPIHHGAWHGYDDIIQMLLENFADKINEENYQGHTPLLKSVLQNHLSTTSILLQRGAQCLVNMYGTNPIHLGAMKGFDEIVKVLLEYFPDKINEQNNQGYTPLHESVYRGRTRVSKLLIELGANIKIRNKYGLLPIDIAKKRGHRKIIELLSSSQQSHKSMETEDKNGKTSENVPATSYHVHVKTGDIRGAGTGANVHLKMYGSTGDSALLQLINAENRLHGYLFERGQTDLFKLEVTDIGKIERILIGHNGSGPGSGWFMDEVQIDVPSQGKSYTFACHRWLDKKKEDGQLEIEIEPTQDLSANTNEINEAKKSNTGTDVSTQQIREKLKNLLEQENIKKNWGDNEKLNLVETCVLRMFLGGKYCYGKTSLARSLLLNTGVMTDEEERTEVLEFNPWKIDDDTTVTLYDLGGHQCYQHLCHLFHCNAHNNFTLLPHQINESDYFTTCNWINDVISRSPKSFIHFILTKSDLVPKEQHHQFKEDFKNHLTKFLKKEIKALSIKLRRIKKTNLISATNEEFLKEIKEKYESIVEDLKQEKILDVVSCKTGEGLSEFRSKLIHMVQSGEFKITIPETAYLLYKQLGKLGVEGVKQRKTITSKKPPVSDLKQKSDTEISRKQSPVERGVSMKTKHEIPMISEQKGNPVLQLNVKKEESLQYVTFEDAKRELIKLLPSNVPDAEVEHQLEHYLQLFHSHGLLLWHNTERLNKFIFNDLFSFIQMLKTLFQHSFMANSEDDTREIKQSSFDFDRLSPEQEEFLEDENISERKYNQLLNKLKDEGVFSVLLLKILAIKFKFEAHLSTLIHILEHLGIAYLIPSDMDEPDREKQDLFFPWYLAQSKVQDDIQIIAREMKTDTCDHFKLKVSVVGMFPSAFFNCFAVRIYNHLVPKWGTQTRMMWPDHIFACINQNQVCLEYVKTSSEDRIDIHVTCPLSVTPIRESWVFVENCLKVINKLSSEWWGGLSRDQYLECLHCDIQLGNGEAKFKPYLWGIEEQLKEECSKKMVCYCPNSKLHKIPAALLYPLPQDEGEAAEFVLEAEIYIKKHVHNSSSQSHIAIPAQSSGHQVDYETSSSLQLVHVDAGTSEVQSPGHEVVLQKQEQMVQQLQVLSEQMFVQGRALERQMLAVHQGLSDQVTQKAHQLSAKVVEAQSQLTCDIKLEAGRAATMAVSYKNPILQYYKDPLEDNLDVTDSLLSQLYSVGVISRDEEKVIQEDKEELGKRKRLLLFIDQNGKERSERVCSFIEVLVGSKSGTQNHILGCDLRKRLEKGD